MVLSSEQQAQACLRWAPVWSHSARAATRTNTRISTPKSQSVSANRSATQVRHRDPNNVVWSCGQAHTCSASALSLSDLHFQDPRHNNKKKTVCLCKEGYHCTTERCYGCEKHSLCQPGHGVKSEGMAHPSHAAEQFLLVFFFTWRNKKHCLSY